MAWKRSGASRLKTQIRVLGGGLNGAKNSWKTKVTGSRPENGRDPARGEEARIGPQAVVIGNLDFCRKRNVVEAIDRYNREKQGGGARK